MFTKPNPKQNFYEMEQEILNWWKENHILEKSIENRSEDSAKTFYDGPITANGEPHVGHMLTFSLKDIVPRYWTMKGFRVSRSLGWDCHGIPVEYEIEKKLGFKEKKDIEKYGIAEFNKLCKESVEKYRVNIVDLEEKMGRLTNDEETYATMDKNFIESVWWSLKALFEKELLYEGFKVVPYSTRAGTTLSNAEVALGGYKPYVDPSVTVEFKLKNDPNTRILAWTTTPWTLPTNFALAVGKKIKYVKVTGSEAGKFYILAEDLLKSVLRDAEYKVVENLSADDLIGLEYEPLFPYFKDRANCFKVLEGFHATTETGTGIVHLAPYGVEDNEIFQQVGIESIDVLDEQGDFMDMVTDYAGMNYRDANPKIIEYLKTNDSLFRQEDYEHEMPMCWRTKTPLIYKPITSWFVAVSTLRDKLVENNNKINWVPSHAKDGRFGNWLAEIKDWGISRKRYWGTPLPVWKSQTGKIKFIGSFDELKELSGKEVIDPHRPYIDEIEFDFEGEHYKRISDVIDVWFDSGSMPFARFHYPFENQDKFQKKFPAEYIAEGIDQTRGWFYSLHAIATTLFDTNAFNNVIINGTIVDDQKRKLSKSLGNYTPPQPLIEMFGADTIRFNFFSTPLMHGEDTTISDKTLKLQKQETIIPLWNIYTYLITYANIHNWTPTEELAYNKRNVTSDDHPWDHIPFDDVENNMDAWILYRLQETIKKVNEELGKYLIPKAALAISSLIADTSKWYIRNSRERFVDGDTGALATLYYVFVETLKLMAPFTPFLTEHIYKEIVYSHLQNLPESIHLCDYPEADEKFLEEYPVISKEMQIVQRITEMGHIIRTEQGIKVRQPLSKLVVKSGNTTVPELNEWMRELLMKELNILDIEDAVTLIESDTLKVVNDENLNISIGLETSISEELKKKGLLREIARQIQATRKKLNFKMGDSVEILYSASETISSIIENNKEELQKAVTAKSIVRKDDLEQKEEVEIEGEKLELMIK